MSDSGSGPADQPAERPNPFSREGAADPGPGAVDPWSAGARPPSQSPQFQSPQFQSPPSESPPFQPPPPYQPEPPHQPAGYGDYPAYGGYPGYGYGSVDHPKATPALVTGILGLTLSFACGVGGLAGIAGVVLGSRAKREIDADPARWTGRGKATAGVLTGAIGLAILVVWVIAFLVGFAAY
ncbi:MAG: hypothetical protein AVDCRST_MAG61-2496 [uncultured Friedmanniella sp.]|uniref:DUF4190 domain-containing protein n=1 Tax=uncultured Friedmanniella sp. TaxID=335381 RepID=A0A6J4KVH4_9ACTN|nr:DUF4190 domain-containing protein [uncultured Friedmanniella sp.]CAA9315808.1 MAG: hypothetical protein AVDCRST_MAG61-2496 [uncultured Friedmanniella sp.]